MRVELQNPWIGEMRSAAAMFIAVGFKRLGIGLGLGLGLKLGLRGWGCNLKLIIGVSTRCASTRYIAAS
jgi:hypothetical protein